MEKCKGNKATKMQRGRRRGGRGGERGGGGERKGGRNSLTELS